MLRNKHRPIKTMPDIITQYVNYNDTAVYQSLNTIFIPIKRSLHTTYQHSQHSPIVKRGSYQIHLNLVAIRSSPTIHLKHTTYQHSQHSPIVKRGSYQIHLNLVAIRSSPTIHLKHTTYQHSQHSPIKRGSDQIHLNLVTIRSSPTIHLDRQSAPSLLKLPSCFLPQHAFSMSCLPFSTHHHTNKRCMP